jgi:catechol 2,3-dioxygenase-like lactoylglutathione lyase family enzyme
MPVARFRKICLDAVDPDVLGRFWAHALALSWRPDGRGEGGVYGTDPTPVLWVNRVPQPRSVKHRVHLDIYAAHLADLEALGSSIVLPEGDGRRWTVLTDPEGGEYCAFLRAEPPEPRLHGVVVDCTDFGAQARFWVDVLGGRVIDQPDGYATADDIPGTSFTLDFVPVPEPKQASNRVHWDIEAADVTALLARGATLLRPPDAEREWHVLADPEGNEFCVFPAPA